MHDLRRRCIVQIWFSVTARALFRVTDRLLRKMLPFGNIRGLRMANDAGKRQSWLRK
jgi:hypothetical protein